MLTEIWKEVLDQKPTESWLSTISENTTKQVKQLLASHEPLSLAELIALPWLETSKAGVYGWILKAKITDVP